MLIRVAFLKKEIFWSSSDTFLLWLNWSYFIFWALCNLILFLFGNNHVIQLCLLEVWIFRIIPSIWTGKSDCLVLSWYGDLCFRFWSVCCIFGLVWPFSVHFSFWSSPFSCKFAVFSVWLCRLPRRCFFYHSCSPTCLVTPHWSLNILRFRVHPGPRIKPENNTTISTKSSFTKSDSTYIITSEWHCITYSWQFSFIQILQLKKW